MHEINIDLVKTFTEENIETKTVSQLLDSVFTKAYKRLDELFLKKEQNLAKSTGAVVVSVLILGNMIYCINLGDSRAVLSRKG